MIQGRCYLCGPDQKFERADFTRSSPSWKQLSRNQANPLKAPTTSIASLENGTPCEQRIAFERIETEAEHLFVN